jgi:hypothetical protein
VRAPELEFAFEARVSVAPPIDAGLVPGGRRRIIPITGGEVAGPLLNGTVIPGGADWQIVRADGLIDLTARYTIRAADGTLIGVVNRGYRHAEGEVLARLVAGEIVDPSLYYFRTAPRFEAPAGPHDWMNRTICVATAERLPGGVLLRFFRVL